MKKIGILTLCQRKPTFGDYLRPQVTLRAAEETSPYLTAAIPRLKNLRRMKKLTDKGIAFLQEKGTKTVLLSEELRPTVPFLSAFPEGIPPAALADLLKILLPLLCKNRIFQTICLLDKTGKFADLGLLNFLRRYGKNLCVYTKENTKTQSLEKAALKEWGLILDIRTNPVPPPQGSGILLADFDHGILWAGRDLKITGIEPDIPLPKGANIKKEYLLPFFLSEYPAWGIQNVCIGNRKLSLSALCSALKEDGCRQKKTC